MTESEWERSDDAGAMLDHLWQVQGVSRIVFDLRFGGGMSESAPSPLVQVELDNALHRFYVASCRGIWKLLTQEASRRGVELTEQFLAGTVSPEELGKYNWHVEGAAFCIDYNTDPEALGRWVAEVEAIPAAELRAMLNPPQIQLNIDSLEMLKRAAYFVDYAMVYPGLLPKGPPPEDYKPFLSASVLRRHVGYPGHARRGLAPGPPPAR